MEYYISLIKTKHLLVFTFYTKTDFNSRIIKIFLFLFYFVLSYAVNALFFTDSTMHQIYEDNGIFNFIYQLPKILYSIIISTSIKKIITIFSLTESKIIELRKEKDFAIMINKMKKLLKYLNIKFILFFIFYYIFLILFWYYISCFCAVYQNTQIYIIEDTSISFGSSLLYPFILFLIPGFFRLPSLQSPKQDKKALYRFSKIIHNII